MAPQHVINITSYFGELFWLHNVHLLPPAQPTVMHSFVNESCSTLEEITLLRLIAHHYR